MGTRGIIGFIRNGELHGSYNQFDMYPEGAGKTLQEELRAVMKTFGTTDIWPTLRNWIDDMRYVKSGDEPTDEEKESFRASWDNVSTGGDWYSYLRSHQGSLTKRLTSGIMTDEPDFLKDSLFCEYGWIFDTDSEKVLVLRGFNNTRAMEWPLCALSEAEVELQKKERPNRDPLYYGCSLDWEGTLSDFLALDMEGFLEEEDVS